MPILGTLPKAATKGGLPEDHVHEFFAKQAATAASSMASGPTTALLSMVRSINSRSVELCRSMRPILEWFSAGT